MQAFAGIADNVWQGRQAAAVELQTVEVSFWPIVCCVNAPHVVHSLRLPDLSGRFS